MEDDLSEFLECQMERIASETARQKEPGDRPADRVWEPGLGGGLPGAVRWVRPEIIEFFPNDPIKEPGRSPRSPSRGWQTRYFSQKAGRVIRGASHIEGLHVLDADFDKDVACICEQPLSIRLPDGRIVKPDAFVWMRRGPHEIREVKDERDAVLEEEKWDAIGNAVAAMGYTYRVVTDLRMKHPSRMANVDLCMSRRHVEVPDDPTLDAIWRTLGGRGMTVGELSAAHPELARKQLLALVRLTFVAIDDLDHPFSDDSGIHRFRREIRRVGAAFRSDCGPPPVPGSVHFKRETAR